MKWLATVNHVMPSQTIYLAVVQPYLASRWVGHWVSRRRVRGGVRAVVEWKNQGVGFGFGHFDTTVIIPTTHVHTLTRA